MPFKEKKKKNVRDVRKMLKDWFDNLIRHLNLIEEIEESLNNYSSIVFLINVEYNYAATWISIT